MVYKGTVRKNDIEMNYCRFGGGDRTFVIIPGLSVKSVLDSADAIEAAYGTMNDVFTTYVFDRRTNMPDDYPIYEMAADTVTAMRELGLSDVNMFGASQGGMIALVIAIRYPQLISRLALGSTSPHVKYDQQRVIENWIELAQNRNAEDLCQSFGREIYPGDVYEQYKGYLSEMAKTVTDEELSRFVICAKAIRDFDVSGELYKIKCPTLALGVFEDAVLDSDATMEIAESLDYREDFALYMYRGYGHAAFDTAPDYHKRVYDFFLREDNG